MKRIACCSVLVAVLLGGCEYEVPVVPEPKLPIDPAVLGLWEAVPPPDAADKPAERMLVLKFNATEYIIRYPMQHDSLYFRAYLIKVGNLTAAQLQLIGADQGPADCAERKFHVASYCIRDDILELRLLNTQLIPATLRTSRELRKEIRKHQADPALWGEVARFKRVADQ